MKKLQITLFAFIIVTLFMASGHADLVQTESRSPKSNTPSGNVRGDYSFNTAKFNNINMQADYEVGPGSNLHSLRKKPLKEKPESFINIQKNHHDPLPNTIWFLGLGLIVFSASKRGHLDDSPDSNRALYHK